MHITPIATTAWIGNRKKEKRNPTVFPRPMTQDLRPLDLNGARFSILA